MPGPFDLKFAFFGGKGGVGKTTCASAFALLASENGRKTLLVSTDAAHSLSDLFGIEIGHRESSIRPNLSGLEIDPEHEARLYIHHTRSRMKNLLAVEAFSKQLDLTVDSPGTQEAAMLDKITDLITRDPNPYDLIVFDTAPTGQTLRLLSLPERFAAWTQTLAQRRRKVSTLWKIFSGLSNEPEYEDAVLTLLEERQKRMKATREVLTDSSKTGFYLVLVAEKLPILETKKTLPVLNQYGIPVRGLIVNRLLPENVDGAFLQKRKQQERGYLGEIDTLLPPHSPVYLHQGESDITDHRALSALARELRPFLQ